MLIRTTIILAVTSWMLLPHSVATAALLSQNDFQKGQAAFQAAKARNWVRVQQIGNEVNDPTLRKLLTWANLIRSEANASFADRASFVMENQDWPWTHRLRRLAENSMPQDMRPDDVISWFTRFAPLTNKGRSLLGAALLNVGNASDGRKVIRDAWVKGSFSAPEEREFLQRHGRLLTKATHNLRLDRLLWNGDRDQARRMIPLVSASDQLTADARIKLRHMEPGADAALAKVPTSDRSEPGLVYERLRWQRGKELNEAALKTLRAYPLDQPHPRLWWKERSILSRRALAEGYVSEAYRATKDHQLTDGPEFADAEWLSGWIALRFLREPKPALVHFERMFNNVKYPISRARGAYWSGRAAELAGDRPLAARWYRTAAQHPTTFYGQLATMQLDARNRLQLPTTPVPKPTEEMAFNDLELVKAVRILAAFGQTNRLRPFLFRVSELKDSVRWKAQAAALANAQGQHDLAIAISKMAAQNGHPLTKDSYPSTSIPKPATPLPKIVEDPLVLSIIRQESAFRANAASPAGALGLMQLLPETASRLARQTNVSYSRARLTTDPGYNIKLGRAYMSNMLQRFDGSYIFALAAYNAGPRRVDKWMIANGQPRGSVFSAIDWIERIPFSETRNYVQRVLETLQVYRNLSNNTHVDYTIEDDLKR